MFCMFGCPESYVYNNRGSQIICLDVPNHMFSISLEAKSDVLYTWMPQIVCFRWSWKPNHMFCMFGCPESHVLDDLRSQIICFVFSDAPKHLFSMTLKAKSYVLYVWDLEQEAGCLMRKDSVYIRVLFLSVSVPS